MSISLTTIAMKLSLAISALVSYYYVGGSTAFQQQQLPPTLASRTSNQNNRIVVEGSHDTILTAATMDGTAMTELVANGARRKKTKEVCNILFNYSVTNSITLWERELVDR